MLGIMDSLDQRISESLWLPFHDALWHSGLVKRI